MTIAHTLGKRQTAADSSRLESDQNETIILKISEDDPTQPIEVASNQLKKHMKVIFFHREDNELPSGKQLWLQKQKKHNAVQTESPVITVAHCQRNDRCINTPMKNMEPINKVPGILVEQDADPQLLRFKRQTFRLPFVEQIRTTNPSYTHY